MGVAVTPEESGVVIAGTVVAVTEVASHNGPSLMEMKRRFESELGLSGTMIDVVDAACLQLGVSTSGLTVMQKAERAYDALDGTPALKSGIECLLAPSSRRCSVIQRRGPSQPSASA